MSEEELVQDVASRRLGPAIVTAVAVASASGLLFSHGLGYALLACAAGALVWPRAWLLYPLAALLPTFALVMNENVSAVPLIFVALPCLLIARAGNRWRKAIEALRRSERGVSRKAFSGGLLLVFLTLFPAYAIGKEKWADLQAKRFCSSVHAGDAVHGLDKRAEGFGLRVMSSQARVIAGESRPPTITAWEGWVFSRHFCDVEHDNSKVVRVRSMFLD